MQVGMPRLRRMRLNGGPGLRIRIAGMPLEIRKGSGEKDGMLAGARGDFQKTSLRRQDFLENSQDWLAVAGGGRGMQRLVQHHIHPIPDHRLRATIGVAAFYCRPEAADWCTRRSLSICLILLPL